MQHFNLVWRSLLLLLLTFTLGIQDMSAQIFFEDFENGMPTTFTLVNRDMRTPAPNVAVINDAWVVLQETNTNAAAASTSWYVPAGQADDWMITPGIAVTSNSVLRWDARAGDPMFADGYSVYALTSTSIPATLPTPLFTIASENNAYTTRTASLSAFANQTIHIAFRNNSNDQFILWVDNIEVFNQVNHDAAITALSPMDPEYTRMPLAHARPFTYEAEIRNDGSMSASNVQLSVNLYQGLNPTVMPVFSGSSSTLASLASLGIDTLDVPSMYTPTDTGFYLAEYIVSIQQTDGNPANDTAYAAYFINDSIFSRDNNVYSRGVGIGPGVNYGLIGNIYELQSTDAVTSISGFLVSPDAGETVQFAVHPVGANGEPDTNVVAITDPYTIQATDTLLFLTLPISGGPAVLPAGEHYFSVIERDSVVSIGLAPEIATPNTSWIWWAANGWDPTEAFGANFTGTYIIRPNFGEACVPFGLSANSNPANCGQSDGSATVTASAGGNLTYTWSNGATGASISNLAAGSYTVVVSDGSGCADSLTVTINNIGGPSISSITPSATSCFGSTDGSATAMASGGTGNLTYTWSTGAAGATLSGVAAGTYTVTVTDGANCQAVQTVTITQPDSISPNASVTDLRCNGIEEGAITLAPNGGSGGGYTYAWSDGSTTASLSSLAAGAYSCTVTDGNNCSQTFNFTVSEPPALAVVTSSTPDQGSGGTATATATGGTPPYTYLWSNGSTSNFQSGIAAGTYTVSVTDANNCLSVDTVVVDGNMSLEDELALGLENLQLYPNPSSGKIWVSSQLSSTQSLNLQVLDVYGKQLKEVQLQQTRELQVSFDLSEVASGVYFLRISDEQGRSATRRFVIE